MQTDFEPVLERQFHYFINGVEGVQHIGQRDIAWIASVRASLRARVSACATSARSSSALHPVFGNIVDKVQVHLFTDQAEVDELIEAARDAYGERNVRIANLTDESVDTFYSCLSASDSRPITCA